MGKKVSLDWWGIGYQSCTCSEAVQSDINAGITAEEYKAKNVGDRKPQSWQPDYTAVQRNGSCDAVFIYFKLWRGGDRFDWDKDVQADHPPIIGKKRQVHLQVRRVNLSGLIFAHRIDYILYNY